MSTLIQITKPTELIVNNTPIIGGVAGRVLFEGTGNVLQQSSNLTFDNVTGLLTVTGGLTVNGGTTIPHIRGNALRISNAANGAIGSLRLGSVNNIEGDLGMFTFLNDTTRLVRFFSNGNVGINQFTDAGFRLDVNGSARVSGQVDISPGLTTMQISSVQQINSRLIQFNTNGASGGWSAGYEFRCGFNNGYGTTTALRIWSNSATNNRIGVGDISESNLQGGNAQVYINSQITGGRNAGVRITPPSTSTTEFSGIQFDIINKDSNGGAFIGSQSNPLTNGYDTDLVILTTGTNPNSYSQTARFMGKYNSFYVGTDKTLAVPSAKMQVESTTQGFLPPRMTTAQKNAIVTPSAGLVVYDTDLNKLCVFTTTWQTITSV
jgi:hypothetical protein